MEWDWQFLTPSSTPTDATFDCHAHAHARSQSHPFQTPGSNSNTNTHFQDAFSPYLSQNAHYPAMAMATTGAIDFDQNNYVFPQDNTNVQWLQAPTYQHTAPQQMSGIVNTPLAPLIPIEASHHRSASSGAFTGPAESYQMQMQMQMQMQTPPPTRGSPTKRRSQRVEPVAFGTPSSMLVRRAQPDQQAVRNSIHGASLVSSPEKQSQPLVSPASFDYPNAKSAPEAMPQPAVWPQNSGANAANQCSSWNPLDDPFKPWAQPVPTLPENDVQPLNRLPRSSSHASLSFPSTSLYQQSRAAAPFLSHASPQRTAGVDPSLVFTSPTRPTTAGTAQSSALARPLSSASKHRIPYQSQLQDSKLGIESTRGVRPRQHASGAGTQPLLAPPPIPRPGLQRSNTTGGSRPDMKSSNSTAASEGLNRSNSASSLSRRASPLKRTNGASLCSISETPKPLVRTEIFLTVDSNGRARTETRIVEPSPTKSIRDKYPNLWHDSDSDSDSGASKQWPSRNSSLKYDKIEERQCKATKLEPPYEGMESLHLPRSNSSASLKTPSKAPYAAATQLRRQSSVKKQQRTTHSRRNTLASLNSSFESLGSFDTTADNRNAQTDAGSALREAVAGRVSQKDQRIQPDPIATYDTRSHQPPKEPRRFHQKAQSVAAPTTQPMNLDRNHLIPIDSAPMQSAVHFHTGSPNDMMRAVTRCICNFPLDDGRGMLQCSFCSMWLHVTCLGLDPQRLPASFACSFCTNSAHAVRSSSSTQNYVSWGVAGI
ncbi:hypothetical protein MBLNU459_g3734t1 [Dothideomycetes sp. NU459]